MADLNKIIAPEFDSTATYEEGQCVLYNKKLYKLIVDDYTAGTFDDEEWEEIYLFDIIKGGSDTPTMPEWQIWCLKGGVDYTQYTSLSNLLDDEIVVRKLMTIHDSADYLYQWIGLELLNDNTDTLDIITNNANAMKWIGLRDYICDKMMNNSTMKSAMLESDNWEYILKDHVPVMTSNTAPYGEASASSENSGDNAYKAFDDDETTMYNSGRDYPNWVQYKFTNPICVYKFYWHSSPLGNSQYLKNYKIQASNDGSNWVDLFTATNPGDAEEYLGNIENPNYYLYYRMYIIDMYSGTWGHSETLQFYGRSLNVSVPTMTSNTEPWGEAIYNYAQGSDIGYKAFDKNTSNSNVWQVSSNASMSDNAYVGYKFTRKVKASFATVLTYSDSGGACLNKFRLKASNDGTNWTEIFDGTNPSGTANVIPCIIDNEDEYQYYAVFPYGPTHRSSTNYNYVITELNFYGVDYSEREFAPNSTMKYIYDHGVEFSIDTYTTNDGVIDKQESQIVIGVNGTTNSCRYVYSALNLSSYILERVICGDTLYTNRSDSLYGQLHVFSDESSMKQDNPRLAKVDIQVGSDLPYGMYLDISSIQGDKYIGVGNLGSGTYEFGLSFNEWWLE